MPKGNFKSSKTLWTVGAALSAVILCFGAGWLGSRAGRAGAPDSEEMEKFNEIYSLLKDSWYYSKDDPAIDERLMEQAIAGMSVMQEDKHTNYLNTDQAAQFSQSLAGSNVGIGVSFGRNEANEMLLSQVFTNSTADKAGLLPGDIILQAGDKVVSEMDNDGLISYIRTFEGKPLTLKILRGGEEIEATVTPGNYDTSVSESANDQYGLIKINSFSSDTGKTFTEAIGRVQKAGSKNLILDLRNNTGGYISSLREVASSLLPDDSVVTIENLRGSRKETKVDNNYKQVTFDHIYILQDDQTASASEMLIGALKDNLGDQVTTIGTRTYGKGTEQVSQNFDDGTSIKYTIGEWNTPSGKSINETGFEPDVEVPLKAAETISYTPMEEETPQIAADTVDNNAAAAQIMLQYLGYPVDRTDAYFSSAGSGALKQFQRDHGLEESGAISSQTFEALLSATSSRLFQDGISQDEALMKAVELIEQS